MSVRGYRLYKVTIANGEAVGTTIYDCDESGNTLNAQDAIPMGPHATGMVYVDATDWTDAELGIKACYIRSTTAADYVAFKNEDGEYDPAGDKPAVIDGIATDAKGAYLIPPWWVGAGWVRLHSVNGSTGADVNQTGDKVLWVLIKS